MKKNILITGAGGGLGCALVNDLLSIDEFSIVCQYRSNSLELKNVFEKHDISFDSRCFYAELTDDLSVNMLKHNVNTVFSNQLYAIINLAGGSTNCMSWKMTSKEFKQIVDTNLLSAFNVCNAFTPNLRNQYYGRIINISSVVANIGTIGAVHYCAAKAGIEGLTKSLALELANKNITVNALELGYFNHGLIHQLSDELKNTIKEKTPLKRFGTNSEFTGIVKFLLSDESSFITGQVIGVNGGISL